MAFSIVGAFVFVQISHLNHRLLGNPIRSIVADSIRFSSFALNVL